MPFCRCLPCNSGYSGGWYHLHFGDGQNFYVCSKNDILAVTRFVAESQDVALVELSPWLRPRGLELMQLVSSSSLDYAHALRDT